MATQQTVPTIPSGNEEEFSNEQIEEVILRRKSGQDKVCGYDVYSMYDLLTAIFGEGSVAFPNEGIADWELAAKCIMTVLSKLTPREQAIMEARFGLTTGRRQTYDNIGKQFNVTRERIRQIERKALHSLRHPSRARIIRQALISEAMKEAFKSYVTYIKAIKNKLADLDTMIQLAAIRIRSLETKVNLAPAGILETDLNVFIDELGVRVMNSLRWSGQVKTVGDLASKTEQELLNLKNFGLTSLSVVKAFLKRNGLYLAPK